MSEKPTEVVATDANLDASLAAAEAKDYAHLREIAREGELARNQSIPTKLLGWLMIAGFGFEIASSFTKTAQSFGGIGFLVVGIFILKGSQSALRFAIFVLVPVALTGLAVVAWSLIHGHPIEAGGRLATRSDLRFWTLGASPMVYLLAEALLAIVALRLRRLRFWTKTVRIWAGILGAIFAIQMAFAGAGLWRNHTIRRDFPRELEAIREHVDTFGSYSTTSSLANADKLARRFPRIREASWRSPNGQAQVLQRRSRATTHGMRPAGSPHEYSEWYQTKSGEWGRLEMQVILRKAP